MITNDEKWTKKVRTSGGCGNGGWLLAKVAQQRAFRRRLARPQQRFPVEHRHALPTDIRCARARGAARQAAITGALSASSDAASLAAFSIEWLSWLVFHCRRFANNTTSESATSTPNKTKPVLTSTQIVVSAVACCATCAMASVHCSISTGIKLRSVRCECV